MAACGVQGQPGIYGALSQELRGKETLGRVFHNYNDGLLPSSHMEQHTWCSRDHIGMLRLEGTFEDDGI